MAFRSLLQNLPKLSLAVGRSLVTPSPVVPLVNNSFKWLPLQIQQPQVRQLHVLLRPLLVTKPLLLSPQAQPSTINVSNQCRNIIKFSIRKGRRKTVRAIIDRFYRLDWGIWIHPKSGRNRHVWKKGKLRKKRLRQHVFTNAWQTRVAERMTTKYWHKKKYWVDDPYESYHTRDSFPITKNIKNIIHQLD